MERGELPPPPAWMTASAVAERWGVDRHTVARWCRSGELSAVRLGGAWRVPLDEVLRREIADGVMPEPGTRADASHVPAVARDGPSHHRNAPETGENSTSRPLTMVGGSR